MCAILCAKLCATFNRTTHTIQVSLAHKQLSLLKTRFEQQEWERQQ